MKQEKLEKEKSDCGDFGFFSFSKDRHLVVSHSIKGVHVFSTIEGKKISTSPFDEVQHVHFSMNDPDVIGYVIDNKLTLYNYKTRANVKMEIPLTRTIYGLKFTPNYIIFILKESLLIFNGSNFKQICEKKTIKNDSNVNHISAASGSDIIAFSPKCGKMCVINLLENDEKNDITFKAHESDICISTISEDGSLLATSSKKGTLIRVFKCSNGKLHKEVRRGRSQVQMYSIDFSRNMKDICCYSSSGTVHIFSLLNEKESIEEEKQNVKSSLGFFKYVGISYLGSEWSRAKYTIGGKGICMFDRDLNDMNKNNIVYFISNEGNFEKISFDYSTKGGTAKGKKDNLYSMLVPSIDEIKIDAMKTLRKFKHCIVAFIDHVKIHKGIILKEHVLPKRKYLIPKKLSLERFGKSLEKILGLNNKQVIFYIGFGKNLKELKERKENIEKLYNTFKSEDLFLYLKYDVK